MRRRTGTFRARPWFARAYVAISPGLEARGLGTLRAELLAGLRGRVVEIGAGNGLNFSHYPAAVEHVTAVEPEPNLRGHAEQAARQATVPVEVVAGVADDLPLATASIDAAVFALVLCSVPDPVRALREAGRVLRSGGELRYLEHEAADTRLLRGVQRTLDATLWPLFAGGCHTSRRPSASVRAAGFRIDTERRLRFPDTRVPGPAAPHVVGRARWRGTEGQAPVS